MGGDWEPSDGPYETHGDEIVYVGTDDTPLSPRALAVALCEPAPERGWEIHEPDDTVQIMMASDEWHASAADERAADRDEDAVREAQL
jgi:hypothetical protein